MVVTGEDMARVPDPAPGTPDTFCTSEIERMLKNSQTKVIMPVVALGLVHAHSTTGQTLFTDSEVRHAYQAAVREMTQFLGHHFHIGAKYEDAYGMRMSRYHVLRTVDHLTYELLPPYTDSAEALCHWIPARISLHINQRLGVVPSLHDTAYRAALAEDADQFVGLIREQIDKTPANFEVFSFAIIKVHLEKFACKIYRDTRTASHDKGVDLSTNFGVVYQIKRLRLCTVSQADDVYAELRLNFDSQRLQDGNVILVIDEISKDIRKYLIDMRVQAISRDEILKLAASFDEPEDRQEVLRVVYEEFRREYSSSIM